MLAITDGQTQGSNIVVAPESANQSQVDKRRNNILKSREIRKNSAKGKRPGTNSVFDRLSNASKQSQRKAADSAKNQAPGPASEKVQMLAIQASNHDFEP